MYLILTNERLRYYLFLCCLSETLCSCLCQPGLSCECILYIAGPQEKVSMTFILNTRLASDVAAMAIKNPHKLHSHLQITLSHTVPTHAADCNRRWSRELFSVHCSL